jgi:hypothetical protein
MTPIRLEGDDDEEDGGDDDKEDEEDDDDESTPVPPSKRHTAAYVFMLAFFAATIQLTLRLLLETASSHGILSKRKKAKTTMKTRHQSRPTRFWVLNQRVRKLRRWMDYWTTTSKRVVVIIEVCDLFVVVTGLGRHIIFSLAFIYRRLCFVFIRACRRHPVLRFAEPIRARVSISHTA